MIDVFSVLDNIILGAETVGKLGFLKKKEARKKVLELSEKYGVSKVVYGHLHGRYGRTEIKCEKNGVSYYMTSCDKLGNRLIEIDGD